jgi:putative transposase
VTRVFTAGRGTYGCRRVAAQLNREGHACSVGLVADLMRELGLRACQPRAYRRTTVPGEHPVASPDLIERDFTAEAPGTRLVGDITYLKTGEGWLYLATVIDLATRMVVGWQLADHMRTSLVVDALQMAITHGHIEPGAVCSIPTAVCKVNSTGRRNTPEAGGGDGTAGGVDEGVDGQVADEVAGEAVASAGCRAPFLA